MTIPGNYKYTKEHEWLSLEKDGALVGVTDFAQSELGEIVFVDLPEVGKKFSKGQTICVLESTKAASDVYAPCGGVVKEVNVALRDDPAIINKEPFDTGWLLRLEGVDEAETKTLMSADEYSKFIE